MITTKVAAFLWDVQRAAERIARFATGHTYEEYLEDGMLRPAVERQFEIIGEAFVGLRRLDPGLTAQLPDVPQIIAFRNMLIHGYGSVNNQTVWDVIHDDLPRLREMVARLLEEAAKL